MSDFNLPDDPDKLRYHLSALQRQIPELRKRTWPGEDAPEVTRLIAKRETIEAKLATLEPPPPTPKSPEAPAECA